MSNKQTSIPRCSLRQYDVRNVHEPGPAPLPLPPSNRKPPVRPCDVPSLLSSEPVKNPGFSKANPVRCSVRVLD